MKFDFNTQELSSQEIRGIISELEKIRKRRHKQEELMSRLIELVDEARDNNLFFLDVVTGGRLHPGNYVVEEEYMKDA